MVEYDFCKTIVLTNVKCDMQRSTNFLTIFRYKILVKVLLFWL